MHGVDSLEGLGAMPALSRTLSPARCTAAIIRCGRGGTRPAPGGWR
ncbi:hypothetical protein ACPA9J_35045 [Pseudomonas aeruginosa]